MSKRGNNIYHRKDNRWEGRYFPAGSKKYKSVYARTYSECKQKLDKLRNEVLVPSTRCFKLVTDIMSEWLESRRPFIKESSYASYRNKLEKHIFPYFAELKYSELNLERLNKFIADKLSDGLSGKYVTDMVIMLKSAAKWGEITHNYANLIRNGELPKAKIKETVVFSAEDQKKLLFIVQSMKDPTACGILLTLFTGLRIGELCALKWDDIDFCRKILHITKTVQRINVYGAESKTAVKVTAPKSVTSVRDIPLPDFLIDILMKYKGDGDDYIVSGTKNLVEPRCFTNRYKAVLKKADLPSLKFHALRHSFATNAMQQSFDIKTLSELLGHSSANITLRVYVHSSMERKSACMNRLQALI